MNKNINFGMIVSLIPVVLFLIAFANILKDFKVSEYIMLNVAIGYGVVILYRVILRFSIFKHYHKGMKLIKVKQYQKAVESFRLNNDFFTAFGLLNNFHSILLFSMSRYSPIEKSLLRMAYCYNLNKDHIMERKCYEECLDKFPNNNVAKEALQHMK